MLSRRSGASTVGAKNLLQLPKVSHHVPKPADNSHTTIRYLAPAPHICALSQGKTHWHHVMQHSLNTNRHSIRRR